MITVPCKKPIAKLTDHVTVLLRDRGNEIVYIPLTEIINV